MVRQQHTQLHGHAYACTHKHPAHTWPRLHTALPAHLPLRLLLLQQAPVLPLLCCQLHGSGRGPRLSSRRRLRRRLGRRRLCLAARKHFIRVEPLLRQRAELGRLLLGALRLQLPAAGAAHKRTRQQSWVAAQASTLRRRQDTSMRHLLARLVLAAANAAPAKPRLQRAALRPICARTSSMRCFTSSSACRRRSATAAAACCAAASRARMTTWLAASRCCAAAPACCAALHAAAAHASTHASAVSGCSAVPWQQH